MNCCVIKLFFFIVICWYFNYEIFFILNNLYVEIFNLLLDRSCYVIFFNSNVESDVFLKMILVCDKYKMK